MRRWFAFLNGQSLLIWYVVALHMLWGFGLMVFTTRVFPLVLLGGFQDWINAFGPEWTGGAIFLFATLAAIGLSFDVRFPRMVGVFLLLPQYAVAFSAMVSSFLLIISPRIYSQTAGAEVTIDRVVMIYGVAPIIVSGILHTLAIINRWTTQGDELTRLRRRIAELEERKARRLNA